MIKDSIILPEACIGILGGGQLGRMLILAGKPMGYEFVVWEPVMDSPAGALAKEQIVAHYEDKKALERFVELVDVVTVEFENIPPTLLRAIEAKGIAVRPKDTILSICQNRAREKAFLAEHHFECVPFCQVKSPETLSLGVARRGVPCVLKSASFGYDGKGQVKIESQAEDWEALWKDFAYEEGILEAWIDFDMEISIIVVRSLNGELNTFPPTHNIHKNHILHKSSVPIECPSKLLSIAKNRAIAIAEKLDCVGLLAVEFFVKTSERKVYVNELAPRPHNSGHWTIDASQTSQFEQHIRAICGLPLGSTELTQSAVMINLLGELWKGNQAPNWQAILQHPRAILHLYNKKEARAGRKMGHFTVLGENLEDAEVLAKELFKQL